MWATLTACSVVGAVYLKEGKGPLGMPPIMQSDGEEANHDF